MVRVLVVEHEPGCPVDRLGEWLEEQGAGLELVRPYAGDAVPARAGADALVVLGGQMGAYDDAEHPWLGPTRDLLAAAARDGVPTLGVCLGAQLLAVACGGRVEVGAQGVEAGVVDVRWRPEAAGDPLVGGLPDPYPGPSMHGDGVVELPPGAVWLARTRAYPHQAFRVGAAAWGVQFHPEVSLPTFRGWADQHGPELDADAVVAELARRDADVVAAGRELAARFVRVARERVAA